MMCKVFCGSSACETDLGSILGVCSGEGWPGEGWSVVCYWGLSLLVACSIHCSRSPAKPSIKELFCSLGGWRLLSSRQSESSRQLSVEIRWNNHIVDQTSIWISFALLWTEMSPQWMMQKLNIGKNIYFGFKYLHNKSPLTSKIINITSVSSSPLHVLS